jgi:hypothetical protein
MRGGADTVRRNIGESRAVWSWVRGLCIKPGAAPDDMVPFEMYASAGGSLRGPPLPRTDTTWLAVGA